MATETQAAFAIGDGATMCGYSDCKAGTIIAATEKTVTWQRDKATLLNGISSGEEDALTFTPGGFSGHTSGTQRYSYEPDAQGMTRKFTLRRNGEWIAAGSKMGSGSKLRAGRSEYYDYNF